MRNRFHEPRSDTPSPRRLDDVNANKSLYGNKRETPLIRCHEPANRPGRAAPARRPARRPARCPDRRRRETGKVGPLGTGRRGTSGGLGTASAGWAPGDGVRQWAAAWAGTASGGLGGRTRVKRDRLRYDGNGAGHELGPGWPRHEWSGCPPGRCLVRDLGKDHGSRDWVSGIGPGLVGHVRLAGNLEHRNPSASDIHPRNRTPVGNVSLGTDDAIQGHRTGPGAIPRNKEGKDGC